MSEKELHVVFVRAQRAQRGEVCGARVRDEIFSGTPGKFGMTQLHGDDHARVAFVSVRKRMDFRNEVMMKANQAFVDRERLVFQPILNAVAEEAANSRSARWRFGKLPRRYLNKVMVSSYNGLGNRHLR
jgi:hypothetical protein